MMRTGIRWLVVVLGFGLGIMADSALPALEIGKANAESNQGRGLELLSRAARSYEAGSYADAAEQIDSAFKAGLTGELAARAILLRAEINERSGASAKALQDYSNALWMEALSPADRKKASDGKERVLASMGLNSGSASGASWQANAQSGSSSSGVSGFFTGVFSGAENTQPPPRPAEEGPRPVSAPVSSASATATQSGSSSSGVWGLFSGVFSGAENTPPPPPAEAQQSTEPAAPAPVQPAPATAPSQKTPSKAPAKPTKVAHAKPAPAASSASAQPVSALSVASAAGEVLIVFGPASSEASGRATAKTIKAQLSDILLARELDVTPRASGGFQVQAGPYKSKSSALALCSAMQKRGVPCKVTP
jgi:outer membrane biosynthesis protein TonB